MQNTPVYWFEIYVKDLDRAKHFYELVLDTELQPLSGGPENELKMYSFPANLEGPGTGGALVQQTDMAGGNNKTVLYFSCEDCDVEETPIQRAGGKVEKKKMSIGEHGYVSLIQDPEGNLFGLHSLT